MCMPRGLLFDFDYTLVDSSDGIVSCMKYAFRQVGLTPPEDDRIRSTIGLVLPVALEALAPGCDHTDLRLLFRRRADEILPQETKLLPGTHTLLATLNASGIPAGIVSNQFGYRIVRTLRHHGLADLVSAVTGIEDMAEPKPAGAALSPAATKLGLDPRDCWYVGDSEVDAQTAVAAGVPFIAVTTGVTEASVLAKWQPIAIMESAVLLVDMLGLSPVPAAPPGRADG